MTRRRGFCARIMAVGSLAGGLFLWVTIPVPLAAWAQETHVPAEGTPETRQDFSFLHKKCDDRTVRRLVGQKRDKALAQVRQMKLSSVRILDFDAPVLFEVVPSRLTLVLTADGQVLRAFCR